MSHFNFSAAVAVVTGGASGIGGATATGLTAEGSRVATVGVRPGPAEAAAAPIPAGSVGVG